MACQHNKLPQICRCMKEDNINKKKCNIFKTDDQMKKK